MKIKKLDEATSNIYWHEQLKAMLDNNNVSIEKFASDLGTDVQRVTDILNNNKPITGKIRYALEDYLSHFNLNLFEVDDLLKKLDSEYYTKVRQQKRGAADAASEEAAKSIGLSLEDYKKRNLLNKKIDSINAEINSLKDKLNRYQSQLTEIEAKMH